jgi:hypothetical protein
MLCVTPSRGWHLRPGKAGSSVPLVWTRAFEDDDEDGVPNTPDRLDNPDPHSICFFE